MQYFKLVFSTMITILFFSSFHATAMGFLPPEDLSETYELEPAKSDDIPTEVNFQKCLPHKVSPDEVCYISGGISSDEVSQFKSRAKEYLLEIVFVQNSDTKNNGHIEEYLAAVQLQINDSKGNVVVDMVTEGPFFLADLPYGSYEITANHNGVIKNNKVKIAAKKHQRIVFFWPK